MKKVTKNGKKAIIIIVAVALIIQVASVYVAIKCTKKVEAAEHLSRIETIVESGIAAGVINVEGATEEMKKEKINNHANRIKIYDSIIEYYECNMEASKDVKKAERKIMKRIHTLREDYKNKFELQYRYEAGEASCMKEYKKMIQNDPLFVKTAEEALKDAMEAYEKVSGCEDMTIYVMWQTLAIMA